MYLGSGYCHTSSVGSVWAKPWLAHTCLVVASCFVAIVCYSLAFMGETEIHLSRENKATTARGYSTALAHPEGPKMQVHSATMMTLPL